VTLCESRNLGKGLTDLPSIMEGKGIDPEAHSTGGGATTTGWGGELSIFTGFTKREELSCKRVNVRQWRERKNLNLCRCRKSCKETDKTIGGDKAVVEDRSRIPRGNVRMRKGEKGDDKKNKSPRDSSVRDHRDRNRERTAQRKRNQSAP